ncbi:transposase [Flavobacterium sp. ZS1P14]|uniref:transposase n=1 Tax=Flavobacterium sp. ZS1P14 TaxID=3401729 RepID=UPI003AAA639B
MFLRTKNTDYAARFQTFNYTYSYREIASAIKGNICFMWLSGGLQPDFRTINDFKGQKLKGSIE